MFVHRSNRMEALVEALASVVAHPLGSPLTPETIVVASKGMERFLYLQLSRRFGVWTNARFPFPRAFIEHVLDSVLGPHEASPRFTRDSLRWYLARLLRDCPTGAEFAPVRGYLGSDDEQVKRFQLAERIAHVFDQYIVYRPELVLEWQAGQVADWQAELWRKVTGELSSEHFAARAQRFLEVWAERGTRPPELPERVSVIGISSLPPLYLKLLAAISRHVEVHLFVLAPCREYVADLRSPRQLARARDARDELHLGEGNALLASLGEVARDFQRVLEDVADYQEPDRDLFDEPGGANMLRALQADVLALRQRSPARAETPPLAVLPGDRSIEVHVCHGRMREVEVLRDQLRAAFDADPTLEPRDVIVMAPEIEVYAPLIDAVFNLAPDDPLYIPYRVADRTARSENPVSKAVFGLLSALGGRMTASELLDLLQLEPIRQRFGIAAGVLPVLQRWVHDAGVRWGVDAHDRGLVGQPELPENTWLFGLRRLLLGYAMPGFDQTLFAGCLPYDDLEGSIVDELGRFVDLCECLFTWRKRVQGARPLAEWRPELFALLDELIATDDTTLWQARLIRDLVTELAEQAVITGFDEPLLLDVFERLLSERLEAERSSHEFLAGGVTFCAMLPMRSIPFRVVYLLGMDDGAFPRSSRPPSFDLIASQPRAGDRSLRAEDRYLFLEALLSARERFCVSYVGRSVQDGSIRPPSVVVSELLDVLADSFYVQCSPPRKAQTAFAFAFDRPAAAPSVLTQVTTVHPLQAFSPRYFTAEPGARLFSYGRAEGAGARALLAGLSAPLEFRCEALPVTADPDPAVDVDVLARFFENPARALLRAQLGLYLEDAPDLIEDREPFEPSPLERYALGAGLLDAALSGGDLSTLQGAMRAKGVLPLGTSGERWYAAVAEEVATIERQARRFMRGERRPPVVVELALGGTRVSGILRDVYDAGAVRAQYSRVKPRTELSTWVRHLALQAAAEPMGSVLVGRPPDVERERVVVTRAFKRLPAEQARALLTELVTLYHAGQRAALRLFPASAKVFVQTLHKLAPAADAEQGALDAARETFRSSPHAKNRPECDDPYIRRAFGDQDALGASTGATPAFADLARRVFEPLLAHLEGAEP